VDGEYVPLELGDAAPEGLFDAIMFNQVIQYCKYPLVTLSAGIRARLRPGGYLVMTYPTNWPVVEVEDLRRWTLTGMDRDLREVGFTDILAHDLRAEVRYDKVSFQLGYGVVARR
jgi:SAM-dependent methyltransferase